MNKIYEETKKEDVAWTYDTSSFFCYPSTRLFSNPWQASSRSMITSSKSL